MTQSRADSLRETIAHTALRLVVSLLATAYVLPLIGVNLPLTYAIRRAFNARQGRPAAQ